MATGKSTRTKEESQQQKHRTAKNKIARYQKLIAERPNDLHVKVWTTLLAKAESELK